MKTLAMLIAAAGLALSLGCSQDRSESPQAETKTPAVAQADSAETEAAVDVDDVKVDDSDLPVAADFEEEADSEITGDNYASILDELESELASE